MFGHENIFLVVGSTLGGIALAIISFIFLKKKLNNTRRKSDKRRLNGREQKAFTSAKQLARQGDIIGASNLLREAGFVREAISILEKQGLINEAANVLIKMKLPNRAGVIYARHGTWAKAAECFELAKMPLEVARCAREANDFNRAAANYLRTEHFYEAAECFVELGEFRKAARYYAKSGHDIKAEEQYTQIIDACSSLEELPLDGEDIQFIFDQTCKAKASLGFADVLAHKGRLASAISVLLRLKKTAKAAEYYLRNTSDISDELIEEATGQKAKLEILKDLFERVSQPKLVAKIYELLDMPAEAAKEYDNADDTDNAIRCRKESKKNDSPGKQPSMQDNEATICVDTAADKTISNIMKEHKTATQAKKPSALPTNIHDSFSNCKILDGISESQRQSIWDLGSVSYSAANEEITSHKLTPDGFYVILGGGLEAVSANGKETYQLKPGDCIAANWVFLDDFEQLTTTTKQASELIFISKEKMLRHLADDASMTQQIYKNITRKMRFDFVTEKNRLLLSKAS